MKLTEFYPRSKIPKHVLLYLHREKLINDPLRDEEVTNLEFLERIWCNSTLVRAQICRLSMRARMSFLQTADIPTKWERYTYSRYRNLPLGKRLRMVDLIEEIQTTFGFVLKRQHIKRLYTVRNRAQVANHRARKQQAQGE